MKVFHLPRECPNQYNSYWRMSVRVELHFQMAQPKFCWRSYEICILRSIPEPKSDSTQFFLWLHNTDLFKLLHGGSVCDETFSQFMANYQLDEYNGVGYPPGVAICLSLLALKNALSSPWSKIGRARSRSQTVFQNMTRFRFRISGFHISLALAWAPSGSSQYGAWSLSHLPMQIRTLRGRGNCRPTIFQQWLESM